MSKQRLKQSWGRKEEGHRHRLNCWLTTPTYKALKALCEQEELTPSEALEEALLERDLLRMRSGLLPVIGQCNRAT